MNHPPDRPILFIDRSLSEPVVVKLRHGRAAVFTRVKEGRGGNQDAVAIIPVGDDAVVLAVADGAGGMPSGGEAARLAARMLSEEVRAAAHKGSSLREGILNGFEGANHAILELGVGAASTLAVVTIEGRELRSYHAGDSGVIVTGQRGKLKLMTMAHSPTSYAQQAGLIDEDAAMHHEDRNVVSNLLGAEDMRIELGSAIQLARFDTVVLGSDGLFDNMLSDEIVACVRKGGLLQATTDLGHQCVDRMATTQPGQPSKVDDLALVVYRLW